MDDCHLRHTDGELKNLKFKKLKGERQCYLIIAVVRLRSHDVLDEMSYARLYDNTIHP
jgi:hypothetical protein